MGLPLLGESLQFLSAGWKGQPEKFFQDRMSKYASNVFKTSLLGDSTIVMCGADANKFLFTNENKLVAAWYPESFKKIFTSATEDGSAKRARKLMSDLTKREGLQGYIGVMDTIAQRHFASDWEGKQEVSVSPLAKSFTFLLACKLFLSMEDTNLVARLASPFYDVLSGIFSIPIDIPGTAFNRAIKASKLIKKQLRSIIMQRKIDLAQKKASPTQDILSLMLMTIDENGQHIKESGIASQILGFLLAGHDTTSSAITSIVMYLAELPEIYENVYKEQSEIAYSKKPGESLNWDDIQRMKYSWSVACEAMRLAPPSLGGFRVALNDFIFQDFCIPKGWKLFWSSYATHTNSEYFSNAKEFDPSRFQGHGSTPYTFVPFGGGSRICPGKEYARLGILVFMHHMVKRFKWKKLILDEKLVVDPSPRPTKGLPIRLIPHQVKV